jgi:trigger factor
VTEVKEAGQFERILTVTLEGDAYESAKDRAARKLAQQVKIKGFRPGKAPRRIVESVVGAPAIRDEAIEQALPQLVAEAILESDLEPAVTPRVEEVRDVEGGVEVDLRITEWPELDRVPEYRARRIEVDSPEVTDEDVDAQIDRIRDQFAELDDVDREGFDGDFAVIDLATSVDGEEIAAGSAKDLMIEIGTSAHIEGLDDAVRGKKAGHIAEFTTTLPPTIGEHAGREAAARVLVKAVKAKRLPEVTDEWVDDVSEFETIAEMRRTLSEQMAEIRESAIREEYEQKLLEELRSEVEIALPDALVEAEMDVVLHRFAHRLETQGVTLDKYFELTGQDEGAFVEDLRSQARLNLITRILLEAISAEEGLEVTDEETDETIEALARAAEVSPEDYREALARGAQEKSLAGDILRRKAIDRLLELAVAVDAEGNEIEFTKPEADSAGDDEPGDAVAVGESEPSADEE